MLVAATGGAAAPVLPLCCWLPPGTLVSPLLPCCRSDAALGPSSATKFRPGAFDSMERGLRRRPAALCEDPRLFLAPRPLLGEGPDLKEKKASLDVAAEDSMPAFVALEGCCC